MELKQLPREENDHANALAQAHVALVMRLADKMVILVKFLLERSIS